MGHEHKVGLQKIIQLCEKTTQASKRTLAIYDIALMAMGHTANQREFMLTQLRQKAIQNKRDRQERDFLEKESKNEQPHVHRPPIRPEE